MGSKRIGLARVQALIEGLKRDLELNGSTLNGLGLKVKDVSAAVTLTNADSGSLINMAGSDYVIKFPQDPITGCTFTFTHVAALGGDGAIHLDLYDGTHFFKGRVHDHEADSPSHVAFNGTSHDQLKFAASAAAHDNLVTCTYVGSNIWLITNSWSHDISDISVGTASSNA